VPSGVDGYASSMPRKEPVEELARQADARNEDPITRREALELDLQERGRSEEGEDVVIDEVVEDDDEDGDGRRR
jgi:hypothetical protein